MWHELCIAFHLLESIGVCIYYLLQTQHKNYGVACLMEVDVFCYIDKCKKYSFKALGYLVNERSLVHTELYNWRITSRDILGLINVDVFYISTALAYSLYIH